MTPRPAQPRVMAVAFPDGAASPDGTAGFIELASGGVLALHLSSGTDLWTANVSARPRLVVKDRLVAEERAQVGENVLQFVTLDLGRGGAVDRRIGPVALPEWMSRADPEHAFEYEVWAEGAELVIAWRGESFYAGGAPPPPHLEAQARRQAQGRVRASLETGQILSETPESGDVDPAASTNPGDAARRAVAADEAALARAMPPAARSACVVGGRGFYLVGPDGRATANGLLLVSVDLQTGKTIWERTLPGWPPVGPPARRQ